MWVLRSLMKNFGKFMQNEASQNFPIYGFGSSLTYVTIIWSFEWWMFLKFVWIWEKVGGARIYQNSTYFWSNSESFRCISTNIWCIQYTDCVFIWFLIWHVGLCGPASEYIRRVPRTYRFSVSIVEQSIYENRYGHRFRHVSVSPGLTPDPSPSPARSSQSPSPVGVRNEAILI